MTKREYDAELTRIRREVYALAPDDDDGENRLIAETTRLMATAWAEGAMLPHPTYLRVIALTEEVELKKYMGTREDLKRLILLIEDMRFGIVTGIDVGRPN
jgi:hypothetical protein